MLESIQGSPLTLISGNQGFEQIPTVPTLEDRHGIDAQHANRVGYQCHTQGRVEEALQWYQIAFENTDDTADIHPSAAFSVSRKAVCASNIATAAQMFAGQMIEQGSGALALGWISTHKQLLEESKKALEQELNNQPKPRNFLCHLFQRFQQQSPEERGYRQTLQAAYGATEAVEKMEKNLQEQPREEKTPTVAGQRMETSFQEQPKTQEAPTVTEKNKRDVLLTVVEQCATEFLAYPTRSLTPEQQAARKEFLRIKRKTLDKGKDYHMTTFPSADGTRLHKEREYLSADALLDFINFRLKNGNLSYAEALRYFQWKRILTKNSKAYARKSRRNTQKFQDRLAFETKRIAADPKLHSGDAEQEARQTLQKKRVLIVPKAVRTEAIITEQTFAEVNRPLLQALEERKNLFPGRKGIATLAVAIHT